MELTHAAMMASAFMEAVMGGGGAAGRGEEGDSEFGSSNS